ncbi:MAG: Ig-like domain-containing protein [Faecousia sp.]
MTAAINLTCEYRADRVAIAEPTQILRSGKSLTLKATATCESGHLATNQKFYWESSDPNVAWVNEANGKVTAMDVDEIATVTITAYSMDSWEQDEIQLTVHPRQAYRAELIAQGFLLPNGTNVTIPIDSNGDRDLFARMYVSDPASELYGTYLTEENAEVTWTSSNKKVAEVDETGTMLLKSTGKTNITASFRVTINGKTTTVSTKIALTVLRPIRQLTVAKKVAGQELISGKKLQLVAAVNADASNKKVTWTSSDPAVAKIAMTPTLPGTIRYISPLTGGLPHQCAHWFAMTAFFMAMTENSNRIV